MNRRNFLSKSLKGAIVPVFLGGSGTIGRLAAASFMPAGVCNFNDRALVVIHLNGANDIINSMVPVAQFGAYVNNRPSIYIPQNKLINLDSSLPDAKKLGLNPALQSFANLYDNEQLAIVQRTGYPQPNRSHFASENIYLRGVEGRVPQTDATSEGWIGRFLRDKYPGYKGFPFQSMNDPLGIMLGNGSPAAFHTLDEHLYQTNLSGQDPTGFYSIISALSGEPISDFPNSDHGDLLRYISSTEKSTEVYSQSISDAFAKGSNVKSYPNSDLGNQLKTVARLMKGGSQTKVFFLRTSGWDTHNNQVDSTDKTKGNHAKLLKDLSDSLKTFQDDLQSLGLSDRILTVVFSEFGRKIKESGTGTDHGTVSSMFVVGKHAKAGVYGNCIDLSDQDAQGAPNPSQLQNDYRSVFASVLRDWLGANNASIEATFPSASPAILTSALSLVKSAQSVDPNCYFSPVPITTIKFKATIFLEGFLNASTGKMRVNLLVNNLLPEEQPFNDAHFNYSGSEKVLTFPTNTVDWVLCELRTPNGFHTIARKAVLLRNDGVLMESDGSTIIEIPNVFSSEYHVAFFHKSHIGVLCTELTSTSVVKTFNVDDQSKVFGVKQLKSVGGVMTMIAGDLNGDGSINALDLKIMQNRKGQNNVFDNADIDGNGLVNDADKNLLIENRSRFGSSKIFNKLTSNSQ